MVSPYRAGEPPKALRCPRCDKPLPPMEVAACTRGCGTWVSQFASTEVLTDVDRRLDPVTRWWRVRAPCPLCAEQMTLRGEEPGLLQGCDQHGFFIDADTIGHTGLARGVDHEVLERKRGDSARVESERQALAEAAERERQRKMDIERKEAELEGRARASERSQVAARLQAIIDEHGDNIDHDNTDDDADDRGEREQRRRELVRTFGGSSAPLIDYILELEDRLGRVERRLDELERIPRS